MKRSNARGNLVVVTLVARSRRTALVTAQVKVKGVKNAFVDVSLAVNRSGEAKSSKITSNAFTILVPFLCSRYIPLILGHRNTTNERNSIWCFSSLIDALELSKNVILEMFAYLEHQYAITTSELVVPTLPLDYCSPTESENSLPNSIFTLVQPPSKKKQTTFIKIKLMISRG